MAKKERSARFLGLVAILGVFLVGAADWLTGFELSIFVFYFVPVTMGARLLGRWAGVGLAVLSACVWFEANLLVGRGHLSTMVFLWDAAVRLAAFLTVAWYAATNHQLLVREREISRTLRQTLSGGVLGAIVPICAKCKKIRDQNGVWHPMEVYIEDKSKSQFSHGFCPDCARDIRNRARHVHARPGG